MSDSPKRFDVFMVSLTSAESSEIRRPNLCVIISPDELNQNMRTITVAPVRDKGRAAPFRVAVTIENKEYQLALDQIRTIDKKRLLNKIGKINLTKGEQICKILQDMYSFN